MEARAFLVGANDWGTRASVSPSLGHKVIIEEGTVANSYYITNYVLQGGMANQWAYAFIDESRNIWVDNTKTGKTENQFTFKHYGDNKYRICLSDANTVFKYTNSEDTYLGVGKNEEDTRLYLCDLTDYNAYPEAECKLTWTFVTPADYETFVTKNELYLASAELKNAIADAKAANADAQAISDAETRYANEASTVAELNAATEAIRIATSKAKFSVATVANPVDVLPILGIATDFTDGKDTGWSSTTGSANKGASNGNNAKDFDVTGNHYENWSAGVFSGGKISATATNLLPGVYRLNALAYTNTGKGATLYAGNARTEVTAQKIDTDEEYECLTVISDGTLEIGLDVANNITNWVGLDNVHLYYLGNSTEAYAIANTLIEDTEVDYQSALESYNTAFEMSVYNRYTQASEAFTTAKSKTGEEYATAFNNLLIARNDMEASIEAYAPFFKKFTEACDWLDATVSEGDDYETLAEYIGSSDEPAEGMFNGNGSALYIIANGLLTPEQIAKEYEYLSTLFSAVMAGSMKDGDDCTQLLVNPDFKEAGGWNSAAGIEWPLGNEDFKLFQAWGRVCDVNQTLKDLQNGIYEMELQAVYKPDNDEAIRQTYAYINDFDTKIGVPTEDNPVNSAEEAAAAFKDGKYTVTAYGLVTDNTMRIGIANRLRTGENGILWAGGVKLIYRAKNTDACTSLLASLEEIANTVVTGDLGKEEIANLQAALNEAAGITISGELGYNALVELKAALDAANKSIELYKSLVVAINGLKDAIDNNSADKITVNKATELYNAALAAYDAKSYNNEAAEEAISELKAITVSLKMGGVQASEDNPADYSSAIVNNNFDPEKGNKDEKRIDGWEVEGALNGYKSNTCSFNKGTFKLSQKLEGLPKGKYKVTVHTFYRAGSYEEEEANINAGKDTHLMKLFANTSDNDFEGNIMNLSEGSNGVTLPADISTKTINGITVPDGTGASAKCYEAGLFLNELVFTVGEDGIATIGLKLDETIGTNDYTVVGGWNLYYMGDPAASMQDFSSAIVNSTFDPEKGNKDEKRIDGWEVEGALNGYKSYSCSFNKGTFKLSQKLEGLPKGNYKVTVHTFYRAGSYEEEEANINAGKDTHLMKLFANTAVDNYEGNIMNLSEGSKGVTLPADISTKTINGITVPDGTGASVKCFEAGLFLNELEFTVGDDGVATIGLKLDETIGTNDYTVVGEWNLYYYGNGGSLNETTLSDLIVNNNFDPEKGNKDEKRIDGWNVSGALNGYKSYSCSFNKGTFDLNQELSGLAEGTYRVTVHTFYRAGSYEEEEANINAGKDTHLMKLYAVASDKTYETSIMNLSEGSKGVTLPADISTKTINGITVPDGTGASVKCFDEGLFLNELVFYVDNTGNARIGLRLDQTIGTNDYTVVGRWDLYYYGNGNNVATVTDIDEIEAGTNASVTPVAYFTVSGKRITAPQEGINIVKMSDGSVVKIMIRK